MKGPFYLKGADMKTNKAMKGIEIIRRKKLDSNDSITIGKNGINIWDGTRYYRYFLRPISLYINHRFVEVIKEGHFEGPGWLKQRRNKSFILDLYNQ